MVALQNWVTACPLVNVQVTVQDLIAEAPAVTVTVPWNPPCQVPEMAYVAVQPLPDGGGGDELREGGGSPGMERVGDAEVRDGLTGGTCPSAASTALYAGLG